MENYINLSLLLEEEDDENWELIELIQINNYKTKRSKVYNLFKNRLSEGYFNLLIKEHLNNSEERFRQFLRLSRAQFYFVLNLITDDLKKTATSTNKNPISPEEKLALTFINFQLTF